MRMHFPSKLFCLFSVLALGCSKPDQVKTIQSPVGGVFHTVETFHGHGAADSDFTRVYVHLEHNGKISKALVLSGTNLTVSSIIWTNPHENVICMDGGITDKFRSEVTLDAGGMSETIHSHLKENCNNSSVKAPNENQGQ